jgi:hypothetical protein
VHAGNEIEQAAFWQTGTAVVQAVCSITLLGWYVLAAHLDRRRGRRERAQDFDSLVRLCRDLGVEAREATERHLVMVQAPCDIEAGESPASRLVSWREELAVIYVCLNEVPHYEVRNPAFSTALTRLWLEVDARTVGAPGVETEASLIALLEHKRVRIDAEIEAMASLLDGLEPTRKRLGRAHPRRGYAYGEDGFPQG